MVHTVEKIGGTSMSDYTSVRDNVILGGRARAEIYGRIFVVSAYTGMTDLLLEDKRSGEPGVYALVAGAESDVSWSEMLDRVAARMRDKNAELFVNVIERRRADMFIEERIEGVRTCLVDLQRVCSSGHFRLSEHLRTVRELVASLGEVHSAYNTAALLVAQGINARLVDLSGWRSSAIHTLDEHIRRELREIDLQRELPIVTGYCLCSEGLLHSYDRGYSEITFARIAVLTGAAEAVIHKEYHLSSADPRTVGLKRVVPIGRTNYDVADQLANLGMEAIHPKAASGLRRSGIALRVKNTFDPLHAGTLITSDYVSAVPSVEIIAGRKRVFALELFDQDMVGGTHYESAILDVLQRNEFAVITKDINANTVTHYLDARQGAVNRIAAELGERFPGAEIRVRRVAIVSAIGSDMQVPGILARAVKALADVGISVLAMHQCMRQVDMQFIIEDGEYEAAVRSLHASLVEVHNHGDAICAA